jgi:CTP:molybdopterin cytidylyltransferase MocA
VSRRESLGAVILAAGASSRMGSPKALLEWEGETFAGRLIARFTPHCSQVVVVLGHGAEAVAPRIGRAGECVLVLNPAPERGQLSSLQFGLRALCPHLGGVFFTPVDLPAVTPDTIARMVAAFEERGGLVIPRFGGRNGHPVLVPARLIPELLAQGPEGRASGVIHAHRAEAYYMDTNDAGVTRDIDTPGDYQRLAGGATP